MQALRLATARRNDEGGLRLRVSAGLRPASPAQRTSIQLSGGDDSTPTTDGSLSRSRPDPVRHVARAGLRARMIAAAVCSWTLCVSRIRDDRRADSALAVRRGPPLGSYVRSHRRSDRQADIHRRVRRSWRDSVSEPCNRGRRQARGADARADRHGAVDLARHADPGRRLARDTRPRRLLGLNRGSSLISTGMAR
jgi:hypothetical protein